MRWILLVAVLLGGCQTSSPPTRADYPYQAQRGPSVDDEIKFYKERVASRPRSFTERNFLAGAYLTKAQNRFDPGYFDLAERTAAESLKIMPATHNPGAVLIQASVAEARHDFAGSRRLAEQVYAQDPTSLEAIGLLANSSLETGDAPAALAVADRLAAKVPGPASLNFRARALMAVGRDDEAVRLLQAAIQGEQPQERKLSARSRSLLGELYLRRAQPELAGPMLEASRQIEPENPFTLTALGKLAERQGDPKLAAQRYSEAFESSRNPALLVELARLKGQAGDAAGAQDLQAKAEEKLAPEIKAGGYGHARDMARLWLDQGKAEAARDLLQEELKRRHDVKTKELLAEALARSGDREGARRVLEEIQASGWADPVVLARLAQLQTGEAAAQTWKAARALDPKVEPSPWQS